MKHSLLTGTILFALLFAGTLRGQDEEQSWFQVEVIVFEYTQPNTDGESWYTNPGLPEQADSIELIRGLSPERRTEAAKQGEGDADRQADGESTTVSRVAYLELPPEAGNLDGVYRVLELASEYRPLYQASWQQPGLEGKEARYVHFDGSRSTAEDNETGENAADDMDAGGPQIVSTYKAPEMAFDAILRLRSSHFLHLDVDAAYFPADPAVLQSDAALERGLPAYQFADYVRVRESRRIRLKELHYFDHPLFGIIVQVTRIEDEDKSEE